MPELSLPLLWKPAMIQMVAPPSIRILEYWQHWVEPPAKKEKKRKQAGGKKGSVDGQERMEGYE